MYGLYTDPRTRSPPKFAVKEFNQIWCKDSKNNVVNDDGEIEMIRGLETKKFFANKLCNIIIAHVIDDRRIVMCAYDGDLTKLKVTGKHEVNTYLRAIFRQLIDGAVCLYDKNLAYVDYKCENIFYKCIQNRIKIYYGDLRSLKRKSTTTALDNVFSTYPDPSNSDKTTTVITDKLMVWGIAIICLQLVKNPHINNFLQNCHHESTYDREIALTFLKGQTIDSLFPSEMHLFLRTMLDESLFQRPYLGQVLWLWQHI